MRGRSFLCLHHQTPPSHCPPSPPHLDLLKHNTHDGGHKVAGMYQCMCAEWGCWRVLLTHLDGRIQGKGSESARSSRHTLVSLQSGWPRSGAARLTPEKNITNSQRVSVKATKHSTITNKTAKCNKCHVASRLKLTASCSSCSSE